MHTLTPKCLKLKHYFRIKNTFIRNILLINILLLFTIISYKHNKQSSSIILTTTFSPSTIIKTIILENVNSSNVIYNIKQHIKSDIIHKYFYQSKPRCFTSKQQAQNEIILRAILIYFPYNQIQTYLSELKWLYLTWIEILKLQSNNLGCKNGSRQSKTEPSDCFVIKYLSLYNPERLNISTNRIKSHVDRSLLLLILKNMPFYRYLDSIAILYDSYNDIKQYDFVLRTDIDSFLTPQFANYIPFYCTFQIGQGGYSDSYNIRKLHRLSYSIGLNYSHLVNIGSTWYGNPSKCLLVARLGLWISIWLAEQEFTEYEKSPKTAAHTWPDWYFGVLSMYAIHLAINHYTLNGLNLVQIPGLLDFSSVENVSLVQHI
ncbi:unnamed protein product [Didymodactylos carnosus]|uniref:DUF7164 domain-containing protein n=1 Tax=Didymodactylos carnosus TaxID=1234261 RepID=A0A814VEQ0_9BILA|nr:unnamed protein product [Didymodactylos carnosus]CAF3952296.1 unnamed protein product [Didymodactylos carnosus]